MSESERERRTTVAEENEYLPNDLVMLQTLVIKLVVMLFHAVLKLQCNRIRTTTPVVPPSRPELTCISFTIGLQSSALGLKNGICRSQWFDLQTVHIKSCTVFLIMNAYEQSRTITDVRFPGRFCDMVLRRFGRGDTWQQERIPASPFAVKCAELFLCGAVKKSA